ncbi:MAG: peroxidase family protein [Phycisphaerales bacterium]
MMKSKQLSVLLVSGLAISVLAVTLNAQEAKPDAKSTKQDASKQINQSPEKRSLVQRDAQPAARPADQAKSNQGVPPGPAIYPLEFRTIDGTNNNLTNPTWGAAGHELVRALPADYADGISTPSGASRPSARMISNLVAAQDGIDIPNTLGLSDFVWQWGQFLDHDIDETPIADPREHFDVDVPMGDAWFDPMSTGTQKIALDRSAFNMVDNVRQQINNITSYIDASNIYGSEDHRTAELRTNDGTGMLKTSAGDLLPFNTNGFDNAPTSMDPSFFLGGDVRANEQIALTAMHTLFMREHNRIAQNIMDMHPEFTGDEIFERTRARIAAQMQAITYNEFLPKLLGPNAIPPYQQYDDSVNPGITNLFATAAYRVGHTMLSPELLRLDSNNNEAIEGNISLSSAFFTPTEISTNGIDSVLRGLAKQEAQNVDINVIDDIRNFLFGQPGSGGFDLASLNLQRGRDHGLPSYNNVRTGFSRPAATTFADINPDPAVIAKLSAAYASVNDVDAWIGLLAEPHRNNAFVGETLYRVLRSQFIALRNGDRFWYQSYLPQPLANQIHNTKLADIIRRNTGIGAELQQDVFAVGNPCPADFAPPFGALNFADVSAFLSAYSNQDPSADLDNSGAFNFLDIAEFLQLYGAGCP